MRIRTNGVIDRSRAGRSVRIVKRITTVHRKESLRVFKPGIGMERICGAGVGSAGPAVACNGISMTSRTKMISAGTAMRMVVIALIIRWNLLNPDRIPEPQPGLFAWKIRPNAGEARYSAEFRLTEIFPAHIPPPR